MNKIVISGYYGFNNIGDESILKAMISNLKEKIDGVEITVLSQKPKLTMENNKVNSVDRRNPFKIIKEIRKCDLLISGGGSLLQDVTSNRSIIYYLSILSIGLIFKKKVMIYSQGVGPINNSINQYFTKRILDKVDFISLRDEESEELLKRINVTNKNITITADPVIGLKQEDVEIGKNILIKAGLEDSQKPTVGFAIRGRNKDQNLENVMAKVSDRIIDELGVNVAFIPFHYGEDIKVLDQIKNKMGNKAIFLRDKYDLVETLSIMGNFDLLIGIRLHSLIFGAVMSTPLIGISYDPKIEGFMESLNESIFCHIDDLEEESLFEEIKEKINNKDEYRLKLHNRIEFLNQSLYKNEEIILKLLSEG